MLGLVPKHFHHCQKKPHEAVTLISPSPQHLATTNPQICLLSLCIYLDDVPRKTENRYSNTLLYMNEDLILNGQLLRL